MEPSNENNQSDKTDSPSAARPEAVNSTDKPVDTGPTHPQHPQGQAGAQRKRGAHGVAVLALLVAAVALGLSGWQWHQARQQGNLSQAGLQQLENRLTEQANAQRQSHSSTAQRLEALPAAEDWRQSQLLLAELQRSQQQLSQRLGNLQGGARADWQLAEAEYLLRLASLRLLAAQDVLAARQLLDAVDEILQAQPDSGVFAVREQLAHYQTELEALPVVDRSGLYLKLSALHRLVDQLMILPVPAFDPDALSPEQEYADRLARSTRGERLLMRLERYVRVDFQRGKLITPQLDAAELQRIRRTLQLTLEQAQWAVLRGEGAVYQASLERADALLEQFFNSESPRVQAVRSRLGLLSGEQVTLLPPDLSALQQGLANYIQSRNVPGVATDGGDDGDE